MTPEAKVKKRIKKLLDDMAVWYFLPAASRFGKAGIPDFICCANGNFLAIEAKANGGQATQLQLNVISDIKKHQGTAMIVDETNIGALERTVANLISLGLYS